MAQIRKINWEYRPKNESKCANVYHVKMLRFCKVIRKVVCEVGF